MFRMVIRSIYFCLSRHIWIVNILIIAILLKRVSTDLVNVGNPFRATQNTFNSKGNVFVIDTLSIPAEGILNSVSGYYFGTHRTTIQIWRRSKLSSYTLVHQIDIVPNKGEGPETIVLYEVTNAACYEVKKGDVLGVFIKEAQSSLTYATNIQAANALRKSFSSSANYPVIGETVSFDGLVFPFQFSVSIGVDIGVPNTNSSTGYTPPNCTEFYLKNQDWLLQHTTTEANLKGESGATGATGPQGLHGATGMIGQVGYNGTDGAKGQKGDIGLQGIQGLPGATGASGPKGESGFSLSKGDKGDQGLKGDPGVTGDRGPQGSSGIKGDNGTQGIQGETGQKGDIGEIGATGLQGIQGIKGSKGDANPVPGATGPMGSSGMNGSVGATGPVGPPGPPGNSAANSAQSGASTGIQSSNSALLKDSIIIILLVWQAITTFILIALCICLICRRKKKNNNNKIANFDFGISQQDSNLVKSVGGKYEGTVIRKGSMLETNMNISYTKRAPAIEDS